MNLIEEMAECIARIEKYGERPDTLIMSPDIFNPRKPYHGGGTNRNRKRRRFRSRKRAEFMRRQLAIAKALHSARTPLPEIDWTKYLKTEAANGN